MIAFPSFVFGLPAILRKKEEKEEKKIERREKRRRLQRLHYINILVYISLDRNERTRLRGVATASLVSYGYQ